MASDNPFSDLIPAKSAQVTETPPNPFSDLIPPSHMRAFMAQQPQQQSPGGWLGRQAAGLAAGAGAAFGRTVLGGQELVGEGLNAVGATGAGGWLVNDARTGAAHLAAEEAPYRAAAPVADFAGQMVGAAPIPAGIAGRALMGARPIVNALATGAISGALEPTTGQNFLREKSAQVGLGAAGGSVAHLVGNALATVLAPRIGAAANMLAQAGVRLTPGQMAGGAARRVEDAIGSLPGAGVMVRGAQRRSVEDFTRAAANEALSPIGGAVSDKVAPGRDMIADAQRQVSGFYDKLLKDARFKVDPQFASDLTELGSMVSEMPQSQAGQFKKIVENRVLKRLQPNGTMDGETFKQVESELTALSAPYRASPDAAQKQLAAALDELKHNLRDGLERSNPGIAPELAKANRSYAMLSRVEDASMNRRTADGVFTPADLLGAIRGDARRTGRRKAFARGDALMQGLAEAAQGVLPQNVPDSGTPERLAVMGLLGLGDVSNYITPGTLAGIGAAALPYTGPALSLANRLAQPAGPVRNALSQGIRQGTSYLVPGAAQSAQSVSGQVP